MLRPFGAGVVDCYVWNVWVGEGLVSEVVGFDRRRQDLPLQLPGVALVLVSAKAAFAAATFAEQGGDVEPRIRTQ